MVTKERGTEASGLSLSNNQARELEFHFSPGDTPGPAACSWQLSPDATGRFEVGTQAIGAAQVLPPTFAVWAWKISIPIGSLF